MIKVWKCKCHGIFRRVVVLIMGIICAGTVKGADSISMTVNECPLEKALKQLSDLSQVAIYAEIPVGEKVVVSAVIRNKSVDEAIRRIMCNLSYATLYSTDADHNENIFIYVTTSETNVSSMSFIPISRKIPDYLRNYDPIDYLVLMNPMPYPDEMESGALEVGDIPVWLRNDDPVDPLVMLNPLPTQEELAEGPVERNLPEEYRLYEPVDSLVLDNPIPSQEEILKGPVYRKESSPEVQPASEPIDPIVLHNPLPKPSEMNSQQKGGGSYLYEKSIEPVDPIVVVNPLPYPQEMGLGQ